MVMVQSEFPMRRHLFNGSELGELEPLHSEISFDCKIEVVFLLSTQVIKAAKTLEMRPRALSVRAEHLSIMQFNFGLA
jgi:hypothetical protein